MPAALASVVTQTSGSKGGLNAQRRCRNSAEMPRASSRSRSEGLQSPSGTACSQPCGGGGGDAAAAAEVPGRPGRVRWTSSFLKRTPDMSRSRTLYATRRCSPRSSGIRMAGSTSRRPSRQQSRSRFSSSSLAGQESKARLRSPRKAPVSKLAIPSRSLPSKSAPSMWSKTPRRSPLLWTRSSPRSSASPLSTARRAPPASASPFMHSSRADSQAGAPGRAPRRRSRRSAPARRGSAPEACSDSARRCSSCSETTAPLAPRGTLIWREPRSSASRHPKSFLTCCE
mmetsp:Transcript_986/g.3307  ORF Transcript_986/g.3307 Transcript_986/m.3307 type:complete len:285 (+) Transcript_986:394-1248(+)